MITCEIISIMLTIDNFRYKKFPDDCIMQDFWNYCDF